MPQLTSSATAPKLIQDTKFLAEFSTKDVQKIEKIAEWVTNDMCVTETSVNENLIFVSKIMQRMKMNATKSQRFLIKYYKARSADGFPDMFQNLNVESDDILKSCQSTYLFAAPQQTKNGHKLIYMKIIPGFETKDFHGTSFFKRFFMVSDIRWKEEVQSKGDILIVDLEGFSKSHIIKHANHSQLYKFIKCAKDTYPQRLHALHFMNVKAWHRKVILVCLKMLRVSKNTALKINIHSQQLDMNDKYLMDDLPGSFQDLNDLWINRLLYNGPWLESQESKYKTCVPKKFHIEKFFDNDENIYASNQPEVYIYKSLEGVFKKISIED